MSDDRYVTQSAWLEPAGRPDLIDEIADQFERRAAPVDLPVAVAPTRTSPREARKMVA
jgi:hypothetical protein